MAFNKIGTFVLGKNDYKDKDSKPDQTGKATINGKEYKIAGWVNESPQGRKYISGEITEEVEDTQPEKEIEVASIGDIPF